MRSRATRASALNAPAFLPRLPLRSIISAPFHSFMRSRSQRATAPRWWTMALRDRASACNRGCGLPGRTHDATGPVGGGCGRAPAVLRAPHPALGPAAPVGAAGGPALHMGREFKGPLHDVARFLAAPWPLHSAPKDAPPSLGASAVRLLASQSAQHRIVTPKCTPFGCVDGSQAGGGVF
jgi:hypothetical protein